MGKYVSKAEAMAPPSTFRSFLLIKPRRRTNIQNNGNNMFTYETDRLQKCKSRTMFSRVFKLKSKNWAILSNEKIERD